MGRKRGPYTIGGRTFPTQKAVIEHVRGVLYRTPVGSDLAGDDEAFMSALLERHPRAAKKIGVGIEAIRVEPNPVWDSRPMFVVVRADGTRTDFSFMKCLRRPSGLARFRAACRRAVAADVLAFKRRHFDCHGDATDRVRCPVTGRQMGWQEVHVDHAPPWTFRRIVDAFIEERGVAPETARIRDGEDGQVEARFANRQIAAEFRRFHAERADLRVIAAKANLRMAKV